MKSFFRKVLNIGLAGFGGPAILGFIKKEFVENEKKLSEREFYEGLSLAQMLPGATGVNLISYIAYKHYGLLAAFAAFLIFIAPSVISMFVFSYVYFNFGSINFVKIIFENINIAVVVIFVITIEKIILPLAKRRLFLIIMLIMAAGRLFFHLNIFILIPIAIAAVLIFDYKKNEITCAIEKPKIIPGPIILFSVFMLSVVLSQIYSNHHLVNIYNNFSKIGFAVFGGGTASIPMIHDVLIDKLGWLTDKEFLTGISIAQLTPGPVLNISTFAGYKLSGIFGSIAATAGIFLPGFLLTLIMTGYSEYILSRPVFKRFSTGILVGFTGLLLYVFFNFFTQTITSVKNGVMFTVLLFLQYKYKLHPLIIILITIILGFFAAFFNIN